MYPLLPGIIAILRSYLRLSDELPDIANVPLETALPNWRTGPVRDTSFEKVGRIAICNEGLEFHSDLNERALSC